MNSSRNKKEQSNKMIEVGEVIIWGNSYMDNDHSRYVVTEIIGDTVTLKLVHTNGIYYEPMENIKECMEEGIITMEREPMVPSKVIKRHSI